MSPEQEAAFAEAASRGERLLLVASDGRTLGTVVPRPELPEDLARAYAAVRLKSPDELTEEDEDVLDSVAGIDALAEWEADGRRTTPLKDVWDELWGQD